MTRLFALSIAFAAFAFSACEKHPLPGQTMVTQTHGSGGAHEGGHGEGHAAPAGEAHAKKDEAHAVAPAHAAKGEEKPTFFPEKK